MHSVCTVQKIQQVQGAALQQDKGARCRWREGCGRQQKTRVGDRCQRDLTLSQLPVSVPPVFVVLLSWNLSPKCNGTAPQGNMEASPEANGKENGKEKAQGKKNDEIEMVTLEIESTTVEPAAPKPVADERVAGGEDDDFEKQFEKQFKALKREGGWKTCLIIFLSIVCALLLCLLIVAMLNVAKYESFSSFECGTRPSLFPFLPPKPEAPTPKPEAPTPGIHSTCIA